MIKIQFRSSETLNVSFTDKVTGQQRSFKVQQGFVWLPDRTGKIDDVPQRFEVNLNDGDAAFAPGFYTLSPECFYLDRRNHISFTLRHLKRIEQPVKSAA